MSEYTFSMSNYHAVKRAEIIVDGITVLTGINGCGKSTLARWLYYTVNCINQFEAISHTMWLEDVEKEIAQLQRVGRVIDAMSTAEKPKISEMFKTLKKSNYISRSVDVSNLVESLLDFYCKLLKILASKGQNEPTLKRVFSNLGIDISQFDTFDEAIDHFREEKIAKIESLTKEHLKTKNERKTADAFDFINREYNPDDADSPQELQIQEDGDNIFNSNGTMGFLLNLNHAIYIDTPFAVSVKEGPYHWTHLQDLLLKDDKGQKINSNAKKLMARISRLINGNIAREENKISGESELRYNSKEGLNINIDNVATGFKSLAYIYRLLATGCLNDRTLLLIDEPEAHLHPEWIVEFAYILVKLHKEIGVKVVVASHNPYMVEAIERISESEQVVESCRIYIGEKAECESRYEYRCLGHDVEEVFRSYNMAYVKIDNYAGTGVQE